MDIGTFKVERWMDEHETKCKYNLAETCIDSLTVRDISRWRGWMWQDIWLHWPTRA